MTGLEISMQLQELDVDINSIYKTMNASISKVAKDELKKVLATLGDKYNELSTTTYKPIRGIIGCNGEHFNCLSLNGDMVKWSKSKISDDLIKEFKKYNWTREARGNFIADDGSYGN